MSVNKLPSREQFRLDGFEVKKMHHLVRAVQYQQPPCGLHRPVRLRSRLRRELYYRSNMIELFSDADEEDETVESSEYDGECPDYDD